MAQAAKRDTLGEEGQAGLAFVDWFRTAPVDRIALIKGGVPAARVKLLAMRMNVDQRAMFAALDLKAATVNRKAAAGEALSRDDGERVMGLAALVGQVEAMVDPDRQDHFDAAAWLANWLREPLPALGGGRPIELLDTMEGQALISRTLAQIGSGAYA